MTENYAMSLQDGAAETQQTHHTGMKITPPQLKGPVLCKTSHLRRVFQSRVRSHSSEMREVHPITLQLALIFFLSICVYAKSL